MKIVERTLNINKKFTKVLVISDTHKKINKVIKLLEKGCYDLVIHLGDLVSDAEDIEAIFPSIPVFSVVGNCDYYTSDAYEGLLLTINGCKMLCCHGHQLGVKSGLSKIGYLASVNHADIAFFGHSHQRTFENFTFDEKEISLFNPGSISLPRDGKAPSFGLLEVMKDGSFHLSFGEK